MKTIFFSVLTAFSLAVPAHASTAQTHEADAHAHGEHAYSADAATPENQHEDIARALSEGGTLVTADVLGMVCDFCAVAMTRTFGRRDEVAAVHVDLDTKTLQLVVAEGAELSDETIADLVRRSGYELTAVHRGEER